MTDRVNALLVVLHENIRSDDVEPLVTAIKQMRNVLTVELNVMEPMDFIAEKKAKEQLLVKILSFLE